jgi:hypothetical protein
MTLSNSIQCSRAGSREFHLIAEPAMHDARSHPVSAAAAGTNGLIPVPPPAVVLPNEPARLQRGAGVLPSPLPLMPGDASADVVVEPVWGSPPPRLLVLTPRPGALRVNGAAAPRLTLLREGDTVQWSADIAFQVAIFHRPHIGLPDAAQVGRPCPVCTLAITETTRVYVCSHCGTALHCEEIEGGFECARLRTECTCGHPIAFHEGYSRQPEWS